MQIVLEKGVLIHCGRADAASQRPPKQGPEAKRNAVIAALQRKRL